MRLDDQRLRQRWPPIRPRPAHHDNAHLDGLDRGATVKTTAGALELERPRLRNQGALGFASQLVGRGVARTHALEALVIASFLRGLSVRDVEAALEECFDAPLVSKSTVSRICQDTRELPRLVSAPPRRARRRVLLPRRDLPQAAPRRRARRRRAGLLGVTLEGRKVLLGLALGSRESYDSWLSFGRDLVERAMGQPALVIADGAPGIWKAVAELWPRARSQRCSVHALRN